MNAPNKEVYTIIGLAEHHLHGTCIERMVKRPSADLLHLHYYPGDSEPAVREIIMHTNTDLQPLVHVPSLRVWIHLTEHKTICRTSAW